MQPGELQCARGHLPCPAPRICNEPAIGEAERFEIKLDAEAAGRRYLAPGGVPQPNPWHSGTRRHVTWTSYFLEATMLPAEDPQ